MLHYHSLSQYKLCKSSPFFTRFGFVPAQLFAQLPHLGPRTKSTRRCSSSRSSSASSGEMPYSLPCDFDDFDEEKNVWKYLEISGNRIPYLHIYTMKRQNTRLYPPWSVYKVVTRIPLYRRKGYPLYRELDMGAMTRTPITIEWRPRSPHHSHLNRSGPMMTFFEGFTATTSGLGLRRTGTCSPANSQHP